MCGKSNARQKKSKTEKDCDIWKEMEWREKKVRDSKEGRGTCLRLYLAVLEGWITSLIFDNKVLLVLQTLQPIRGREKYGNVHQTHTTSSIKTSLTWSYCLGFPPQNPLNSKSQFQNCDREKWCVCNVDINIKGNQIREHFWSRDL